MICCPRIQLETNLTVINDIIWMYLLQSIIETAIKQFAKHDITVVPL